MTRAELIVASFIVVSGAIALAVGFSGADKEAEVLVPADTSRALISYKTYTDLNASYRELFVQYQVLSDMYTAQQATIVDINKIIGQSDTIAVDIANLKTDLRTTRIALDAVTKQYRDAISYKDDSIFLEQLIKRTDALWFRMASLRNREAIPISDNFTANLTKAEWNAFFLVWDEVYSEFSLRYK